ncbi:MAG: hypothetical protein K5745_07690 [Saccharofermentans sp.]|nr:hypothetical protein [Saccharofermentans sp.]
MSFGSFKKPTKKAVYGTTERDIEKRRSRVYLMCAIILIICGILDIFLLIGILDL